MSAQIGRTDFGGVPVRPKSPPPWPPPPLQPPSWGSGSWPAFVTPPWSHNPWTWPAWWRRAPLSWQTNEGLGACDPWSGWVNVAGCRIPMQPRNQLAQCQGLCPQGWVSGVPHWKGSCSLWGCPWLCRGCQAGWPYDTNYRHVGPAAYPNANRWECNRVKFLGAGAVAPYQIVG